LAVAAYGERMAGGCLDCARLGILADLAKLGDPKSPSWPRSGGALSGELRRLAPALRSVGIHVVIGRTETRRFVKITAPDALE
jgi:hypothetical protein